MLTYLQLIPSSGQIRDIAADRRMPDDVVDAQIHGELLFVAGLGLRKFVGVVGRKPLEEVLPVPSVIF